jgi:hypothetical protein
LFLSLAKKLGVQLVYLYSGVFDEDAIDEMMAPITDETDEETPSPDVEEFSRKLQSYTGRIWTIIVQWVYGNIVHIYLKQAEWYIELSEQADNLAEVVKLRSEEQAETRKAQKAASIEKLASSLARVPEFQTARLWEAQSSVAKNLYPDTDESDLFTLVRRAQQVYAAEIVPELEKAQVVKARELIASGQSVTKVAAEMGMTANKLQRMIARYKD